MLPLSDFDFPLPPELIAQTPARPRDAARLLRVDGESLQDLVVRDLPSLLQPGDILVANDTKVLPAQLTARRGQARIGITLDRPLPDGTWHALARNARRLRTGDHLTFEGDGDLQASLIDRDNDGGVRLRFLTDDLAAALERAGALALPPYIARPDGPTEADKQDYQTIFARAEGAVAAPTAGLHFTPALLDGLAARGVERHHVTLHVGVGTFLPVRSENVLDHRMHPERGVISAETAAAINAARVRGASIIAVGTTSLRLLESAAAEDGSLAAWQGETRLFITPGHKFKLVHRLLTNFHLPRSTLFMLVSAFAGQQTMRQAYMHAIAEKYRFFSYGDASLLTRR